jgi:hypothetical protein
MCSAPLARVSVRPSFKYPASVFILSAHASFEFCSMWSITEMVSHLRLATGVHTKRWTSSEFLIAKTERLEISTSIGMKYDHTKFVSLIS